MAISHGLTLSVAIFIHSSKLVLSTVSLPISRPSRSCCAAPPAAAAFRVAPKLLRPFARASAATAGRDDPEEGWELLDVLVSGACDECVPEGRIVREAIRFPPGGRRRNADGTRWLGTRLLPCEERGPLMRSKERSPSLPPLFIAREEDILRYCSSYDAEPLRFVIVPNGTLLDSAGEALPLSIRFFCTAPFDPMLDRLTLREPAREARLAPDCDSSEG